MKTILIDGYFNLPNYIFCFVHIGNEERTSETF